ncbi:helix-turn-helix transcriptional regulator [Halostella pelagica]|uniref:helix-turn-helix transcriptional regulator n=1 Tax=Halostella pelagica TaxID=2583824 RepID=UPI0010814DDF|nr:helix-turn-helix domain-containing protein [Halostella pelagica]
MTRESADETLERRLESLQFAAGSSVRVRILRTLADGDRTSDDLKRRLDVPRTTLRRNLVELTDRHWIDHDAAADAYGLTPAGELVLSGVEDAIEPVGAATDVGAFLRDLPVSPPVAPSALAAAEITVATEADPFRPVSRVREHLDGTGRVRGFVPVINPVYVSAVTDLQSDAVPFEFVTDAAAIETFRDTHRDAFDLLLASPTADLYVADSVPEYGIALLDEHVFVGGYDGTMRPNSTLRADRGEHRSIVEWATDAFDRVRARATPLD